MTEANSVLQANSEEAERKQAHAWERGQNKEEAARRKAEQERKKRAEQLLEAQRTARAKRFAERQHLEGLAGSGVLAPALAESMPPRRASSTLSLSLDMNVRNLDEQLARALQDEEFEAAAQASATGDVRC